MTRKSKPRLTPKLRFPEFRNEPDWSFKALGEVAVITTEKAGDSVCIPMSITSGIGLVSQESKFGRTIAGNQYKNYIKLNINDFAYNKSATKEFPQGFIARYTGDDPAAVPNSIFTCFRIIRNSLDPRYLDYLFSGNLHGKWLKRYITVGARAHGSLAVDNNAILSIPIPWPEGKAPVREQQKIAECLGSLDELIGIENQKLDALKAHKKGLMQQLFPREGETVPRLRFPEFKSAPEWEIRTIGEYCLSFSGGTPSTSEKKFYGGTIPFIRSAEIGKATTELFLTELGLKNSAAKLINHGDVLVALYGANSGDVAIAKTSGAINQAILCLRPDGDHAFLCHYLSLRKDWIIATYLQGGQGNLSGEIVKSVSIGLPNKKEQRHIAQCLSSTDDLIAAQAAKVESLKIHKRGLMQQLFPSPEEVEA
jgi:type I restriction enzyme S subunit